MTGNSLQYDRMVENALKGVVREALLHVAAHGLTGQHHFYITFRTRYPGVQIPDYLLARYPEEITIVLQHQFWGLEIDAQMFAVTLSFSGVNERLVVPFDAVAAFADPSAKFGLQFQVPPFEAALHEVVTDDDDACDGDTAHQPAAKAVTPLTSVKSGPTDADAADAKPSDAKPADAKPADGGQVIALDAFRKK